MAPSPGERSESASAPPPAAVPGNAWTEIDPPALGELPSTPAVSVVIEGDRDVDMSPLLDALEAQTYPGSRIQVIAPGDQSADLDALGEVLIFLADGAIPEPTLVEAHVRWHLAVADAATAGPVGAGDGALGLVRDLTRRLTELDPGLYRAGALGNVGVRRETAAAIGAARAERADLRRIDRAQRLACHGALFVPEPAAACASDRASELAIAVGLDPDGPIHASTSGIPPDAAALVPAPPFRPTASPRRFRHPGMVVNLDANGASAGELADAIAKILGGRCGDLELRVQVPDHHPERTAIEAAVAATDRASIAPPSTSSFCPSPVQVMLPGVVMPDPRTLGDLYELVISERVGVMRVTIPGISPEEATVDVYSSGPLARARRVAAHIGEPLDLVLMRLFGERWISGVEVSIRPHGVEEAEVSEHGMLAAATDFSDERIKHLRYLRRADDAARQLAANELRLRRDRLRVRAERLRADRLEERAAAARRR